MKSLLEFSESIQALKKTPEDYVLVPKAFMASVNEKLYQLAEVYMDDTKVEEISALVAAVNPINYDILMRVALRSPASEVVMTDKPVARAAESSPASSQDNVKMNPEIKDLYALVAVIATKLDEHINNSEVKYEVPSPAKAARLENETPQARKQYTIKVLHKDLKELASEYEHGDDLWAEMYDYVERLSDTEAKDKIILRLNEFRTGLASSEALDEVIFTVNQMINGQ